MERLTKVMTCPDGTKICDISNKFFKLNASPAIMTRIILEKLAKYEDSEERGLLLRLPCKIGSDVYIVPSEMNFRMNIFAGHPEDNRVYHQKVALISFTENGWYMEGDKDRKYDTDRILPEKKYKETWFLSREEAEARMKEMEGRAQ